jgi:hypothetical protein
MTTLTSAPYRKCDRLCERILVVLVWLFLTAIIGGALLSTTRLVSQAGVEQSTGFVARFILCPSLLGWLGFGGVLLIWHEVLLRRSLKGKADRGGAAVVIMLLAAGVCMLTVVFFLVLRLLGG